MDPKSDTIPGHPLVMRSDEAGEEWGSTNGQASKLGVFKFTGNENIYTGWAGVGRDENWSFGRGFRGLAVAPTDANRLIISDYGFVHASSNGGATWEQKYVQPPIDIHPVMLPNLRKVNLPRKRAGGDQHLVAALFRRTLNFSPPPPILTGCIPPMAASLGGARAINLIPFITSYSLLKPRSSTRPLPRSTICTRTAI